MTKLAGTEARYGYRHIVEPPCRFGKLIRITIIIPEFHSCRCPSSDAQHICHSLSRVALLSSRGVTGELTNLDLLNLHRGKEEHMERAGNPTPNVLLMLSMALGVWVLVYVAAASVWTWRTDRSKIVTESKHHQQVAAVADKGEAKLSTRRRAKVNRRRPHATSLAARVFRSTI
jgi:hypothetical protein